jgi:hypothetical protein
MRVAATPNSRDSHTIEPLLNAVLDPTTELDIHPSMDVNENSVARTENTPLFLAM